MSTAFKQEHIRIGTTANTQLREADRNEHSTAITASVCYTSPAFCTGLHGSGAIGIDRREHSVLVT